MNSIIFTTFIILGIQGVPSLARPDIIKGDVPYYLACGGALNESFAAISYKADISVNQYERCVWTIRSPTAIGYMLEVLSFGLQTEPGDIGITATCITKQAANSNVLITSVEITSAGVVNLATNCHILMLAYYSGENIQNSRGFAMVYTETTGSSHGIATTSMHQIVNTVQGHLRYPLSVEQTYANNEISTFVFAPLDNIHRPERKTVVSYVEDGLEPGCCGCDYLRVFKFQSTGGWADASQSVCGGSEYQKWESDDMVMILFHSDTSNVGRGFHLVHSHELTSLAQQCV